jgi:hypothetical protein
MLEAPFMIANMLHVALNFYYNMFWFENKDTMNLDQRNEENLTYQSSQL